MPTSTNFGYLLYCTPVTTMPPESASLNSGVDETSDPTPSSPTAVTSSEVVSPDSTFALYEEALAETQTVVRDEAKAIIKQRMLEIKRLRTTLARAEEELAKLLKKTPEEIASIRTFSSDKTELFLKQLRGSAEQNARRSMGLC